MRLKRCNKHSSLFSVGGQSTQIQIVASASGLVLDLQATNIGTDGQPRRCHATAKLPLDLAMQVEIALQQAIDVAWGLDDHPTELTDSRQAGLWSDNVLSEPVRRIA